MNRILTPIITFIVVAVMITYTGVITSLVGPNDIEVTFNSLTEESQKQVRCLAQNIYFESAYEPDEGKLAVAFVTLNRTKHPSFPSSVCGVVTQKTKSTCQFSWFCQEKEKNTFLTRATPHNEMVYEKILELATFAYVNYDKINDPSRGALFYHADYVHPKWKNVTHTRTIGRHIFYTEKDVI